MEKFYTLTYEDERAELMDIVENHGLQKVLDLFNDPLASAEDKKLIYDVAFDAVAFDAVNKSIWEDIDENGESLVNYRMSILAEMDAYFITEADLDKSTLAAMVYEMQPAEIMSLFNDPAMSNKDKQDLHDATHSALLEATQVANELKIFQLIPVLDNMDALLVIEPSPITKELTIQSTQQPNGPKRRSNWQEPADAESYLSTKS